MTTVALIPTYQPDARLIQLVSSLRARGLDGVVVDDGSGERYRPIFQKVARLATVIGYGDNRGKGHALKRGMLFIREHYAKDTVVVTVDADGQHNPDDVERCAQEAAQAEGSMVLGCRSFDGAEVPLRSRIGNRVTRAVYRFASGLDVSDTQTGLRSFSVALIDFLVDVVGERYEYEMNVLLACPSHHVQIREVPIRTIYEEGNASSHFRAVQDSCRIYAGILLFATSSLTSFCIDYVLFAVLSALLVAWGGAGIAAANVVARLASGTANFLLNRTMVFHSSGNMRSEAARYALLALSILAGNTVCVLFLAEVLGVTTLVAKLATELLFFFASWVAQNRVVFTDGRYS